MMGFILKGATVSLAVKVLLFLCHVGSISTYILGGGRQAQAAEVKLQNRHEPRSVLGVSGFNGFKHPQNPQTFSK